LLGVSNCASSSKAGDRTASATCDIDKGCATSGKAGTITAQTTCGAGDCHITTRADVRGADTFCQARGGCSENGKLPTTPDAKDLAAAKTDGSSQTNGACTK